MNVQNEKPAVENVKPVIDQKIVNTVFDIFKEVSRLNDLQECFEDLANRLIADLKSNSFMEVNLELKEDQKEQLRKAIKIKGNETVKDYLAKVNTDERTKKIYGIVREKTTAIIDSVLSSIGREINRGAIINAQAVQANAKNEDYDEILLRKTKTSGDITIPTNCLLISTNCVALIKASCQEETDGKTEDGAEEKKKKRGAK
jgi:Na+-transporting NADH:ubiquinone oxidoreductase subunit NqrC